MGRSAKVTRTVGLRALKNAKKGVIKPVNATKMRRRKEKAERIKAALEEEAEARRQARKSVLAKREKDGAKATAGLAPNPKGFFSLGAAAAALDI